MIYASLAFLATLAVMAYRAHKELRRRKLTDLANERLTHNVRSEQEPDDWPDR